MLQLIKTNSFNYKIEVNIKQDVVDSFIQISMVTHFKLMDTSLEKEYNEYHVDDLQICFKASQFYLY